MLDLLGTLPDTELTLTHFDDGRAADEEVLKQATHSRNLNYQRIVGISRPKEV